MLKLVPFVLPFFLLWLLRFNGKVSDGEESEGKEPSWEKQEAMVRRLQKKFPDQDKEVSAHTVCNTARGFHTGSHFCLSL